MPITGRFEADFTKFLDAVRSAEVALVDMDKGAAGVSKRLENLTVSFSGRRVIQEATLMSDALERAGGTSKLTASELERVGAKAAEAAEKLTRLGYDVPPGIQKLADETAHLREKNDDAGISVTKLVESYLTAQAIIGGLKAVFNALTGEISRSITAASEAEKAHNQLVAALKAQGTATPEVVSAFGEYASALQRSTIYQDDAIESAEALLVLVGNVMPRDMEKALKATTDLASGLGKDLNEAALLVAKAAEGNTNALKRSGIVIDETKAKAEGFGYVLDEIEKKFSGQAAALAGTYEGRLKQLGNTWNNVEESIGRVITQNATVLRAFELINGVIDQQTGELKDNATATNLVSEAVILTVRAFGSLAEGIDLVQTGGAGFMITIRNMAAALANLGITAISISRYLEPGVFKLGGGQQAIDALKNAVAELGARNESTTQRSIAFGNALQGVVARARDLAADLEKTKGKTVDLAKGTDTAKDAWERSTKSIDQTKEKTLEFATTIGLLDGEWNKAADGITIAGDHIHTVIPVFAELARGLDGVGDKMEPLKAKVLSFATTAIPYMRSSLQASETAFEKWFGTLESGLSQLPRLLEQGLTGGGGFSGALKALTANIGGGLFAAGGPLNSLGNSLTKSAFSISTTFGNALGAALPGLGSLIGPAIQGIASLFGKIFGNPEKQINPLREAFVQAAGGLDALNIHAHAAGVTLDALLNAKNAEQYKKAVDDLTKAFAAYDQQIESLKGEIAGLQKSTEVDFNKMADIAKKYGVGLESLGPKFQAAQIGASAKGIIDDFDTLNRGLGDVDEALTVMRKPINDIVNDSLKFKTAIPENFRPWVEQLLKTHQLIDENGDEIKDLTDIKFGAPIATEFEKVTDKIGELTKKLDDLIKALGNIKPVKIDVGYNYEPFNPPDTGGKFGAGVEPIRAAGGFEGRVTQPTLFLAGESGPENVSIGNSGGGGGTPAWASELLSVMRGLPRMLRDGSMGAAV